MNKVIMLFLAFLLAGCETVRYRMVPPPSETGRLCVTQCAGIQEMCLGREEQAARYEQHRCERREDDEYRHCMRNAGDNRDKQKKCQRQKNYCGSYANTSQCEAGYRSCFANCGGMVIREVEQW